MTFKELLDRYTWEEIYPVFLEIYPAFSTPGYEEALRQIKSLTPEPSRMMIGLETVSDEDESYVDVSGMEDGTRYGLDFVPWEEWLSMEVSEESLAEYEPKAIIAHCLWEMTFYGYSNTEVAAKSRELYEAIREIGIVEKESEHAE